VTRPQDIRQENVPQGVALAPYADVPLSETFWDAARDYADDGKLTKQTREKLVRTLRTALQGVAAAVVVAVAPMAWDLVQGQPTQLGDLVTAAKVAAVTTLISYVHPKAKK
jgi:spore germination protein YaaH